MKIVSMIGVQEMEVQEYIRSIKRRLGYSYPYSAGSATINCRCFTKDNLDKVLKYFLKRECSIVVNYEKNQITISGYMKEF
jgi:hypothetical protein